MERRYVPMDPDQWPSTSPLTHEQMRRRRRLVSELLWVCTIALIGWAVYIGLSLPRTYDTRHWDLAWSGFDGLEILAFGATAYFGWRGRQLLIATAIAAATLLVCDAWFDIALDLGTSAVWGSVASAVFIELPIAFFLFHRVRLLLRFSLLHLFPESDEKGRPMSLGRLPLLTTAALYVPAKSMKEPEPEHEQENGDGQGHEDEGRPGEPATPDGDTDPDEGPRREPGGS
jgi:hypothetical protein